MDLPQYQIILPGKKPIIYTVEKNGEEVNFFFSVLVNNEMYHDMGFMTALLIEGQIPTLTSIYVETDDNNPEFDFRGNGYAVIMLRVLAEYLWIKGYHRCFDLTDASLYSDLNDRNIYNKVGCGPLAKNIKDPEEMNTEEKHNRICNLEDVLRETHKILKTKSQLSSVGWNNSLATELQGFTI